MAVVLNVTAKPNAVSSKLNSRFIVHFVTLNTFRFKFLPISFLKADKFDLSS